MAPVQISQGSRGCSQHSLAFLVLLAPRGDLCLIPFPSCSGLLLPFGCFVLLNLSSWAGGGCKFHLLGVCEALSTTHLNISRLLHPEQLLSATQKQGAVIECGKGNSLPLLMSGLESKNCTCVITDHPLESCKHFPG